MQLAAVTEERNKLRNVANSKSSEAGDESKCANPVQVTFPPCFLSFNSSCDLSMVFACCLINACRNLNHLLGRKMIVLKN